MQNAILQPQPTSLENLRKFAEGGFLFALLDADSAPGVVAKAKELGDSCAESLVSHSAEEQQADVAAYLLAVNPSVLDWILSTLWQTPWGIFILSKAKLEKLSQHFRRFLIVQLPDQEKWFFRFYDPRIFRVYITHCNEGELRNFFGPARAFAIPEEQDLLWLVQAPPPLPGKGDTDPNVSFIWQIREEQYQAFAQEAQRSQETRLMAHLGRYFPEQCRALGEEETRRLVQHGLQRAATYQIMAEDDVCKYLNLMFGLGRDFDHDPRLAWARSVLEDNQIPNATEKINRVYATAMGMVRQALDTAAKAES